MALTCLFSVLYSTGPRTSDFIAIPIAIPIPKSVPPPYPALNTVKANKPRTIHTAASTTPLHSASPLTRRDVFGQAYEEMREAMQQPRERSYGSPRPALGRCA